MMNFRHAMIRVKDVDKSIKFYTELLNMKFSHKQRLNDCELYYLDDESGNVQIELTLNDKTPECGYTAGENFGHFAFSCDSLDKFSEKLHSLGYEYLYEPFDVTGKGSKIAFLKDPDGNEIELVEKVLW